MENVFRANSLKSKVILSIIAVIVLGTIISTVIVITVVQYQMTGKYAIEKEAAIEAMSLSLTPILDAEDYAQVERVIESALVYENIASVVVFDESGTLLKLAVEPDIIREELEIAKHDISIDGRTIGSFDK